MKWSRYNFVLDNQDGNFVLYNMITDKLLVIRQEIYNLIECHKDNIDTLNPLHPSLYRQLHIDGFIIKNNVNEFTSAEKRLRERDIHQNAFEVIINPTLDCNLRCWYCYEKHLKGSKISPETYSAIQNLFRKKITETPDLQDFILSFFGGEPLMEYESTIRPLVNFARSLCMDNNVRFQIRFVSNGVFLTNEICRELANLDIPVHFQIPFDGDEATHDKVKKDINGKGTYAIVKENMKYGASKGIQFNIRCNYHPENIESFSELVKDFKPISEAYKENIHFSFHKIWQKNEDKKTVEILEKIDTYLEDLEISKHQDRKVMNYQCYSDSPNSVLINFNGDVYKCTARDFERELREGVLLPDGTIKYNERYRKRMAITYSYKACRECDIYPICHLCSQRKLESSNHNICLKKASEKDKQQIIIERMQALTTGNILPSLS